MFKVGLVAMGFSPVTLTYAQDALQTLAPLTVVGSVDDELSLPGSAAYVDAEEFRERGYTNLAQVAARVPGVYVRDEDGFGNFPSISLRGVNGNRSARVSLMEDGILTAPSPYSAPDAYYSPKLGRMSGIEFLKGSSQVKYGPQTTGGVVNYLSTPVPEGDGLNFFSRTTYGSHNTFFNHTWYGDTQETAAGRVGYLLELHTQTSDGLRDIQGTSRDSGFDYLEPMLKVFWEPNTALKQRVEVKVGFTEFDANESYTGLSPEDVRRHPDRRYAATADDRFESEHFRSYLKWIAEPTDAIHLESAVYFNSFERRWNKLNAIPGGQGQGSGTSVGAGLLDPVALQILQGRLAGGRVEYQDAFRDHEAYGWQNQVNYRFNTGGLEHDLAVGLRLHEDKVKGWTARPIYTGGGDGRFTLTNAGTRAEIAKQETFATAVFLEDAITVGALTLRPGVRYEWLDVKRTTTGGVTDSADESLTMGGLGANYQLNDCNSIFGGVYRGASPANPTGYIDNNAKNEESLGFEMGLRHRRDGLRGELVGFYTEFDRLIAPQVLGTTGTDPSQNAGAAEVWGLEALVEYDHGQTAGWAFGLPVYASATWTSAEFKDMNGMLGGSSIFAGGRSGNEIPYIPDWKLAAGIGFTMEKWGVHLDAIYSSSTWGTGYNAETRPGAPTAVDGEIPSLLTFDLTGNYRLNEHFKLVGGIQNLFDKREIASRAPLGPRSNSPRMLFAGVEAQF
jgi:Fe(3+) dicitrate transport protein